MKVPKSIKIAAYRMARHSAIANKADNEIREWLIKNEIYHDGTMDMLIDSCELSNNPDGFIEFLEKSSIAELKDGNVEYYAEYAE